MTLQASAEWMKIAVHSIFSSVTLTVSLCVLIVATCLSGDYLLFLMSNTDWLGHGQMIRAATDSFVHALVGALVWAIVENFQQGVHNCLLCALLAALVDIDHFLAAGSLDLQKALNLPKRPYFHNTSLIVPVMTLCWALKHYIPALKLFSLMFLTSWLSHHFRDAGHRGLWLFPFGHTPVFPSYLYIMLILLLSVVVRSMYCADFNTRCVISTSLV